MKHLNGFVVAVLLLPVLCMAQQDDWLDVYVRSGASDGIAISLGEVSGSMAVNKFGQAADFDSGDGEVTIWDGANDAGIDQMEYNFSTECDIDSVSSSDASDDQVIEIQGLCTNYLLATIEATLNGTNRVALSQTLTRTFRMRNIGTNDLAGNVYVYPNTTIAAGIPADTTKIRAMITGANNQTLMAIYTIPAGKTGLMTEFYAATAGATKTSNYVIKLWAREYDVALGVHRAWRVQHVENVSDSATSGLVHTYHPPKKFAGKTDIRMTVEATENVTACDISGGFDLILVDD